MRRAALQDRRTLHPGFPIPLVETVKQPLGAGVGLLLCCLAKLWIGGVLVGRQHSGRALSENAGLSSSSPSGDTSPNERLHQRAGLSECVGPSQWLATPVTSATTPARPAPSRVSGSFRSRPGIEIRRRPTPGDPLWGDRARSIPRLHRFNVPRAPMAPCTCRTGSTDLLRRFGQASSWDDPEPDDPGSDDGSDDRDLRARTRGPALLHRRFHPEG